jgi:predicted DNA-binding transcriptional regulator YafY
LYVFGWCHLRSAMRTFAVHRFRQVVLTEKRFERPATFSPEAYLCGAFRIWRGENAVTVRLAVDAEAAGWIGERRWHASQKVRRYADGGCELTFTVDGLREIERFVLQLGAAAEVIEPAWLRRQIAREHARAARRNQRRQQQERMTLDDTNVRKTGRG